MEESFHFPVSHDQQTHHVKQYRGLKLHCSPKSVCKLGFTPTPGTTRIKHRLNCSEGARVKALGLSRKAILLLPWDLSAVEELTARDSIPAAVARLILPEVKYSQLHLKSDRFQPKQELAKTFRVPILYPEAKYHFHFIFLSDKGQYLNTGTFFFLFLLLLSQGKRLHKIQSLLEI